MIEEYSTVKSLLSINAGRVKLFSLYPQCRTGAAVHFILCAQSLKIVSQILFRFGTHM